MFDSGSEVNTISSAFIRKLGLHIQKANVGAQKINGSTFETFEMIIADFQLEDKGSRPRFFQKIFLVANTKFEMILGIPFLKISNADIVFGERTLMWKSYITNKALLTTKQDQLVDPKKFIIAALDTNSTTFVLHVVIQGRKKMVISPGRKAQIEAESRAQVGALLFDKAPTEILAEYSNYSKDFSVENAA